MFSSRLDLRVFLQGVEEAGRYLVELNDMAYKLPDCQANAVAYMADDAYGFGVELRILWTTSRRLDPTRSCR